MDDAKITLVEADAPYKRLAKQCKRIRKYHRLTQPMMAERLNTSTRSIQNMEAATHQTNFDTLYELCKEFDLDPRTVFCPEKINLPDYLLDLNRLISGCSEYESSILTPIVTTVLDAIRTNKDKH